MDSDGEKNLGPIFIRLKCLGKVQHGECEFEMEGLIG